MLVLLAFAAVVLLSPAPTSQVTHPAANAIRV